MNIGPADPEIICLKEMINEAFEMWIWKQMEKISCRDKITYDDVLKRVNEERSMLKEIWQRKHG